MFLYSSGCCISCCSFLEITLRVCQVCDSSARIPACIFRPIQSLPPSSLARSTYSIHSETDGPYNQSRCLIESTEGETAHDGST